MRLKCVVAYLRYVRVINVCKEDWNFQHVQYVDKYSNCIYIFTTYVLVIIIIREPCEVLIYVEYVQQATPRTKKLSEQPLKQNVLETRKRHGSIFTWAFIRSFVLHPVSLILSPDI